MRDLLTDFTLTRYMVLVIVLLSMGGLLYWWGFFRFAKNVIFDCLMDHKTGYYTINNLARFLTLFSFIFLFISTHFNVTIKPAFRISTVPLSEIEYLVILGFIIGAEWVKKNKASETLNPNQEI